MEQGKAYTVKEWFANKVANEVRSNITMCDIFAIMKETEKAVYAMLNIGCDKRKCMWVPKSAIVESTDSTTYDTVFESDYDTCVNMFAKHWEMFK